MAFGKWSNGELTWANTEVLEAADLNISIEGATPPIGAVMAWAKSITGVPQTLPSGWVECNGQTVNDADSPLNGVTLPNLNASGGGTKRFLRGSSTSGSTGGSESHSHLLYQDAHCKRDDTSGDVYAALSPTSTDSSLPPYYEVVWIVRIK